MVVADPSRLHTVQYLRGFAALAVVAFHATRVSGYSFDIGAAGVDVFFVISGLIMWVTTAGREATPADFATRRLVRIVPLYWIVTLATCAAMTLKPNFFPDYGLTPAKALKSLLFIPVYEDGILHPTVIQGWTLYYELFFYALFALSLLAPLRIRALAIIGLLAALVALGALIEPKSLVAANFTHPLLLEFAGGVLVGWLLTSRRLPGPRVGGLLVIAGLAAFAVAAFFPATSHRAWAWGLPALALVAGAVAVEQGMAMKPVRVLAFLGDASYSVYLWHVLVIVAAGGVFLWFDLPTELHNLLVLLAALTAPLVLYVLIERPLTQWLSAAVRRPRRLAAKPA